MLRLIINSHDDGHVNRRAKSGFLLIKQNKQILSCRIPFIFLF
jgi:hypothetical protein